MPRALDPLTHTLVGANLAATRLGGKTRLATAALVAGANLPDVDSILYFTGHHDLALGFRRGWTHGILALVVLPFVLTGLLLLYDRLRPDPSRRASPRWLLALSALAIVTHPTLDWLNNYGMRWLMPFDGSWSYGDAVFIMDPLLWLVLGAGWLAGRRPTRALLITWALFTAAIAWVVGGRSNEYLLIVGVVAAALLFALLWRAKPERRHAFATGALAIAALYMGGRLAANELTESAAREALAAAGVTRVSRVMASPHPLDPRRWEIVAETPKVYRYGGWEWGSGLRLEEDTLPVPRETPEWIAARRAPEVQGFMTWARFPWYEIERTPTETRVWIQDARYARRRGTGFGGELVILPNR
ncbi:MAG: metal-dependent hydrolase [Thermoanaerobaculia bacterium]